MHVKQLTTSQAFQMILRKASVYQEDVKALQESLCLCLLSLARTCERATTGWRRRRRRPKWRPLQVFEVTGQLFAYSTSLLQHVTVYENSTAGVPAEGAGGSWTHTYTH